MRNGELNTDSDLHYCEWICFYLGPDCTCGENREPSLTLFVALGEASTQKYHTLNQKGKIDRMGS